MLLPVLVTLTLFALGAVLVVVVAYRTMRRLGLDAELVLEWLGLAETPGDEAPARHLVAIPQS